MSLCAVIVMLILFLSETMAFATTKIVTSIAMDETQESQIRLNFNITLLDLHCDYVSVDVWDALGTNRQNVTKNVDKWQLDGNGDRRIFAGRNREMRDVKHDEHNADPHEVMSLMTEEHHAVELTKENFQEFLEEHDMVFIDMFAPWYVVVVVVFCCCCWLGSFFVTNKCEKIVLHLSYLSRIFRSFHTRI